MLTQPAGPIVVRGLGRHLELKELAQRQVLTYPHLPSPILTNAHQCSPVQAEEKAERERKAFLTHVPPAPPKHYTVPTPFTLSSNNKKHQVRRLCPHPSLFLFRRLRSCGMHNE